MPGGGRPDPLGDHPLSLLPSAPGRPVGPTMVLCLNADPHPEWS